MKFHSTDVSQVLVVIAVSAASTLFATRRVSADSFDWRNYQGYNWNTPIESQFGGTCWDFSACGTLEAKYKLTRNDPSYNDDVSEQQVCWEQYMGSTNGGWGPMVLDYFTSHGVVSATECPYQSSSPNTGIAPYWPLASGWQNRVWKTVSNSDYFTNNTATMKAALKTYGPLEVGCLSTNDLYTSVSDLETNYRGPVNSEDHEVSLVGYYDDSKVPSGGYWVIKNSWGSSDNKLTDYGNNGYYLIPYGDIENHNDISAITGAAYYAGAMVSATWKGGSAAWSIAGNNWTNDSGGSMYYWQNQETAATFGGTGTAVTVSGTVIAHGVTIAAGSTGYSFTGSGAALTVTAGGIVANESVSFSMPITVVRAANLDGRQREKPDGRQRSYDHQRPDAASQRQRHDHRLDRWRRRLEFGRKRRAGNDHQDRQRHPVSFGSGNLCCAAGFVGGIAQFQPGHRRFGGL